MKRMLMFNNWDLEGDYWGFRTNKAGDSVTMSVEVLQAIMRRTEEYTFVGSFPAKRYKDESYFLEWLRQAGMV